MRLRLLCTCILGLTISSVRCQVLSFDGISEIKPLKRGNTYQVMWTGGNVTDHIILELVKDDQNFGTWKQANNQGNASIRLPHNLKPDDNYYFKISNSEGNSSTMSTAIEIRRKIPLGIKLIGIAVVPLVIIILTSDESQDQLQIPNAPTPN